MRVGVCYVLVAILLISLLSPVLAASTGKPPSPQPFELLIIINRLRDGSGALECRVAATDVKAGQVVFTHTLVAKPNRETEASETSKDGRQFTFSITINGEGTLADYHFVAARGKQVLQETCATIPVK